MPRRSQNLRSPRSQFRSTEYRLTQQRSVARKVAIGQWGGFCDDGVEAVLESFVVTYPGFAYRGQGRIVRWPWFLVRAASREMRCLVSVTFRLIGGLPYFWSTVAGTSTRGAGFCDR